jgi:mannitol/fructose-specific phosphotransferase system IIA component (Ntr-type)
MTLADFTTPGLLVPQLRARDATGAIHELSLVMQREGGVPDWLPFYHETLNREFLLSTDMEAGMAFPHARLSGLKDLVFAFGRSDAAFAWGPEITHQVRMVFLLAVPVGDPGHYLSLVSGLARLSRNPPLLATIFGAADAGGIMMAFRQITLHHHPLPAAAGTR